jgi:alpha-L-rhamnosidase
MSVALTIENLRCEYAVEPLGLDVPCPRLSWSLVSAQRGQEQTACRALVASTPERLAEGRADLWDSGKVISAQQAQVEYRGRSLLSGQRAYWRVRVWDRNGVPSSWSPCSWWEMGLLDPGEWKAEWIAAPWETDGGAGPPHPAPHFRKSFHLDSAPDRARAYVAGLGWFELYVNGRKVSDDVLVPNQTDYDQRNPAGMIYAYEDRGAKRVAYLTYDITPLLRPGENVLGVILGNGWYNQRARTVEGQLWYGAPRLLLRARMDMPGGETVALVSDASWKVATGPIVYDQVFGGEVYDARLEKDGWNQPGYADSDWQAAQVIRRPTGTLCAQTGPPDRVMATLRPVAIRQKAPGQYEVDFGQNFAGWLRLKVQGPRGQEITCRFIQHHNENPVLRCTLKGGGLEVYEPRFTWFAFRKVDIEGWPGELTPDSIEGRVVYTAVDTVGEFLCSKQLLNDIHRMYLWSQMSNMHGAVPSDCPHRERLGYTGDGQVACETAIRLLDMPRFYTKWVTDMADAQHPETGYVPHTVPYEGGGGGPGWGSAFVIVPWQVYRYYGDKRILEAHYEGMKRWVGCLASWSKDYIVKMQRERAWNLGDWCVPGGSLPEDLVHTFYYGYCAKLLARIASVLDRPEDARRFSDLHGEVCRAFHERFFRPDTGCYLDGRYGADVFALALGAPPRELRDRVADSLARNIMDRNHGHLDTGILATALLPDVLTELGRDDLMFTILSQTTFPSYGYWRELGHTTTLECWDGSGSDNHPMFGSAIRWLYTGLAGLNVDMEAPGYEHFLVQPHPLGDVTRAAYRIKTLRGLVSVAWRRDTGRFSLSLEVPVNCRATVCLPAAQPDQVTESGGPAAKSEEVAFLGIEAGRAVYRVGSGHYEFVTPMVEKEATS